VTSSMVVPTRLEVAQTVLKTEHDEKRAGQKSLENGELLTKSSTLEEVVNADRG
jgi:hypothetical protein